MKRDLTVDEINELRKEKDRHNVADRFRNLHIPVGLSIDVLTLY